MRLSLFTKLFISILLVCLVMLVSMTVLINSSFQNGLQGYLNNQELEKAQVIAEKAKVYYSDSRGWGKLTSAPYLWRDILSELGELPPPKELPNGPFGSRLPNDRPPNGMPPNDMGEHLVPFQSLPGDSALIPISLRINLLDEDEEPLLGERQNLQYDEAIFKQGRIPIVIDQKTIGWVTILQSRSISGELAESFFKQQSKNTFVAVTLTVLLSFVIAFYLVRHFLKPLTALHEGAKAVEKGELDFQIEVKGQDELAMLTQSFNQLVQALKKQKRVREQWLSDISHELRTPITVLRSEIEAIQDGIRQTDARYIASLHQQVMGLGKLVEDLYQLSLSDSGVNFDLSEINHIEAIVADVVSSNKMRIEKQDLSINFSSNLKGEVLIVGESKALHQLFLNLVENSIRYTNSPGKIAITIEDEKKHVKLLFEDSYPSVPEQSLLKLFDRLYRVDKSRSRESGGSGLGLSICKNIVEAHGGSISAKHSPLGGLCIEIHLPKV